LEVAKRVISFFNQWTGSSSKHFKEEVLLGAEVVVDRCDVYLRAIGDLSQANAIVAMARKELLRDVQNALSSFFPINSTKIDVSGLRRVDL
jgi:hypothetical protein